MGALLLVWLAAAAAAQNLGQAPAGDVLGQGAAAVGGISPGTSGKTESFTASEGASSASSSGLVSIAAQSSGTSEGAEVHKTEFAPPAAQGTLTSGIGVAGALSSSGVQAETQNVGLAPPASVSQSSSTFGASEATSSSGGIVSSIETHKVENAPPASIGQNSFTFGSTGSPSTGGIVNSAVLSSSGAGFMGAASVGSAPPATSASASDSFAVLGSGLAPAASLTSGASGVGLAPPAVTSSSSTTSSVSADISNLGMTGVIAPAPPADKVEATTSSMGSSSSSLFPEPTEPPTSPTYIPVRKVPYYVAVPLAYQQTYPYLGASGKLQYPFGYRYPLIQSPSTLAFDPIFRYLRLFDLRSSPPLGLYSYPTRFSFLPAPVYRTSDPFFDDYRKPYRPGTHVFVKPSYSAIGNVQDTLKIRPPFVRPGGESFSTLFDAPSPVLPETPSYTTHRIPLFQVHDTLKTPTGPFPAQPLFSPHDLSDRYIVDDRLFHFRSNPLPNLIPIPYNYPISKTF